jgi:hypothetical protein
MAYFIPDYTKEELTQRIEELEKITKENYPEIIINKNDDEMPFSFDLENPERKYLGTVYPGENRIYINRKDPEKICKSLLLAIASRYEKSRKGFWAVKYEEKLTLDDE